jgi:hypothetical protein
MEHRIQFGVQAPIFSTEAFWFIPQKKFCVDAGAEKMLISFLEWWQYLTYCIPKDTVVKGNSYWECSHAMNHYVLLLLWQLCGSVATLVTIFWKHPVWILSEVLAILTEVFCDLWKYL